jgi:hypothetical protein
VFAVKKNLVVPFPEVDDAGLAHRYGLRTPFRLAEFGLVLAAAADS